MSWRKQFSLDNIEFFFHSGDYFADTPRVCLSVEQLLEMGADDFESLKEWLQEYAGEVSAIESAKECHWDTQFLEVDQLLLIMHSKMATEKERNQAKQVLDDSLKGIRRSYITERPTPPRSKIAGYVYLLSADNGLFKIGKAQRLNERVTQLSVKLPVKITLLHAIESNDYSWAELHLHELFASKREHGEWFKLEADDLAKIKEMQRLDMPESKAQ